MNTGVQEIKLKFMILEFGTMVMNNFLWSRVSRKPMIFKKTLGIKTIFLALESNNLDEIGDWVNASERVEYHILVVDTNCPRTNEVDMDFMPWKNRSVSWSELSMRHVVLSYLRADWAARYDIANDLT